MPEYVIYADGACSGNPGPGGYAWELWKDGRLLKAGSNWSAATTNNIMELMGLWNPLVELMLRNDIEPGRVRLRLDSEYVLKGVFEWLPNWKANGWRTASKKPVKNQKLWREIDGFIGQLKGMGFTLEPDWVRGHSGDPGNERVDARAVEMRDRAAGRVF